MPATGAPEELAGLVAQLNLAIERLDNLVFGDQEYAVIAHRAGADLSASPPSRSRSASTIIRTRPSKSTVGSHPSRSRALAASPTSRSTSAGRMRAGSVRTCSVAVEAGVVEGELDQAVDRVGDAGGHHVVVGLLLLEHPPHRLDVVAGEAPVAAGVEVAQRQVLGAGRA